MHDLPQEYTMEIRPMVALRAALVGGIAAFAKIGGAIKAGGAVKVGAAAAAVTAAASAAISGKDTNKDNPKPETK
jgi:FAD/FMN-containing dehydrogenase